MHETLQSSLEGGQIDGTIAGAETDKPVAKQLAKHAAEIRILGKRVVGDVIEIGRRLTICKDLAGHGNWLSWLDGEFGWSDDTALNFIRVYEMSKSRNFRDLSLPISGLYLLAAPSTPEAARDEASELAKSGPVSHQQVKRVIDRHKPKKGKAKPLPGAEATNNSVQPDLPFNHTSEPKQGAAKSENPEPTFSDADARAARDAAPRPEAGAVPPEPAKAPQPLDPTRDYLAHILGAAAALSRVPHDADFDAMVIIIDPSERERCKRDMSVAANIARRLEIALMRFDLKRGDPPTLPAAAE